MPLYSYKCEKCENEQDAMRKIADRENGPECCGETMKQRITGTMLAPVLGGGDFPGYRCPVTDEFVTSRKRRKEIMNQHNLVEAGDK